MHVILFVLRMINVIHVILVTRDIVLLQYLHNLHNHLQGYQLYMPPKSQTIWDYGIPNAQIKFGTDY